VSFFQISLAKTGEMTMAVALACDLLTLMNKTYRPVKKQWVETPSNQHKNHETTMARGTTR
jgi:hypothetical protein